jgi:hypothetical protein
MDKESIKNCIKECLDCYKTCTETRLYCLAMGGEHAGPKHLATLEACAEICRLSAHLMMIDSEFQDKLCKLCAEICEDCAKDCDSFTDDDVMHACADVCKRCALACREMSK